MSSNFQVIKMMVGLAKTIPEDMLLRQLEECVKVFRCSKGEKQYEEFFHLLSFTFLRYSTSDMSIDETIKKIEEMDFIRDIMVNKNMN